MARHSCTGGCSVSLLFLHVDAERAAACSLPLPTHLCWLDAASHLPSRLNGFGVLLLVEALLAYDTFSLNGYYTLTVREGYWGALAGANVAGLLCSAAYATVPPPKADYRLRCSTVDRPERNAAAADEERVIKGRNSMKVFFFGYQFNPRVNGTWLP